MKKKSNNVIIALVLSVVALISVIYYEKNDIETKTEVVDTQVYNKDKYICDEIKKIKNVEEVDCVHSLDSSSITLYIYGDYDNYWKEMSDFVNNYDYYTYKASLTHILMFDTSDREIERSSYKIYNEEEGE